MRRFKDQEQEWMSKEGKSRKGLKIVVRKEVLFLGYRGVTVVCHSRFEDT